MLLILLASSVVSSLAAPSSGSKYCCTPDQWQGDVGIVMGSITNKTVSLIEGTMRMSFDGVNKIITTEQNLLVDDKPFQQRMVSDYKNNVGYLIQSTGCIRTKIGPWLPSCVPDNATETHFRYGLGENAVEAKGYYVDFITFEMYFSVTADTCVPLAQAITGRFGESEVMETLTFVNIKPGIANRNVFDVPAQCENGPTFNIQEIGRRAIFA